MEGDPQPTSAAEAAASGQAESPASAPASSGGGPNSWEAAFADDAGASNRGHQPDPEPATPAPAAASAPSPKDGASNAEGAPAEPGEAQPSQDGEPKPGPDGPAGQREPQPGSRRSTAEELTVLREQVKTVVSELETERASKAEREAAEAKSKAEADAFVERFMGKPGEMTDLLTRRMQADQTNDWSNYTTEDDKRLTELTQGALLYQPLQARARAEARAEVEAEAGSKLSEAQQQIRGMLGAWQSQIEAAAKLDLPGLDPGKFVGPDSVPVPDLIRHAHAAGAASRDGDFAELQGKLLDAQGKAFASQPHLARGGVSGNGRTERGYDPTRSPASNLEDIFRDEPVAASTNGRR